MSRRSSGRPGATTYRPTSPTACGRTGWCPTRPDLTGLWLAEGADGVVVCAGRLEVVPDTEFAGLWGGGTLAPWRGHGIYRALVAARARAALAVGVVYLHSDCTDMSRPILERSGMVAVTTTTPYTWTRA